MGKQIMMVISMMRGGGAERVSSLLMNECYKHGCEVEYVLTSSASEEVIRTDLMEEIPLTILREETVPTSVGQKLKRKAMRIYSSLFCRLYERLNQPVPSHLAYVSFVCQYWKEIQLLRDKMMANPRLIVVAFLQPSIPMVLLAARGLPNKVIISERDNPKRLMKKRYGRLFVEKYYARADGVVYQTKDAMATYPKNISSKGVVIPNPIKGNLPEPYRGERSKTITTFCRISKQKNLPMLIRGFAKLQKDYPEYTLKIIGDANNEEDLGVRREAQELIEELGVKDQVIWEPFCATVHQKILRDAMYVNSSDFEGMSNAMLEAMAIGMPVVCTDCPIGGAKAMIQDGENGLLIPVGDYEALYQAMKKVIENPELAEQMSEKATELRETLSLETIAKRWMELL